MKLIYGTKNPSKLESMKHRLRGLEIELVGLDTISRDLEEPEEAGNSPLENAKIKALSYFHQLQKPVMSADSGLYFDGVEDIDQPGVFIKRIHGKDLDYSDLVGYYSKLATKYGGKLRAHYKNAICLVIDENNIFSLDGRDLESEPFYIVDKPHSTYKEGFPLDSLSVDIQSNQYYYDLEADEDKYHETRFGLAMREFIEAHMSK